MSLFNIGFVIFPDVTQLDFTGPLQVLSRLPQSVRAIADLVSCRRTPSFLSSAHRVKVTNPKALAVKREAEGEWSR
jgi:hypothetical protein